MYRSKVMLYIPWKDESFDLLGGYMDFRSHYEDKIDDVLENEIDMLMPACQINRDTWRKPGSLAASVL